MFDKERFALAIDRSGLKKRFIAKELGMAYDTFLKKCSGTVEWKVDEALGVSRVLRITKSERDCIFFG